ncbi:MAG: spermidine synthase, partial [Lachnospiraceae bacterium]|nr:spermidine synthase [Lachnospiraceae bacterium]
MVKEHLKPEGVMVVNMNMYNEGEGTDNGEADFSGESLATINTYLADTISSVFDKVITVKVPGTTNRELFAGNSPDFLDRFKTNYTMEENETLRSIMQKVSDTYLPYQSTGHIMTDDKAPVELLGMRQIDSIIKNEVDYYKNIFDSEGIDGLLELL